MALHKIKDFDPDYRQHFDGDDVKDLDLYSGDEKIGSVNDVLVDENGQFRYLIINTGAWIFGKKVMLPVGRARIDYNARRVYAEGLTKQQVEDLPEFSEDMQVDYDHEERVRSVYRSPGAAGTMTGYGEAPLESSAALNSPVPVEGSGYTGSPVAGGAAAYDRSSYRYEEHDPDLFNLDRHDDRVRLYQERLIGSKTRRKSGEVAVGKHVETETARVDVPVEKERVVIERTSPTDATAVTPGEATFQEGEVARMEVYEETPDVRKEAYVREEVRVKKVVDQETVTAEEKVRREELDIDTQGRPVIDNDRNKRK
ncbi:DUF2382 domain-containing protein [Myxacorys almedinensis]|uniref:DUF2382 domain-containing protein n=1 Tax=Myxacorys almedinensis A TaxID=2690445 RepID=A0A8J7Z1F4_9CYAN|nr:DUF2382 domain-containing protein [Myxacorys almedinensis]NDJ17425.1 DUF2382 domain-containing protein [Myxacorys almedinensis A]